MEEQSSNRILNDLQKRAKKNLKYCGNCAQSPFLTLQEEFSLGGDNILKALTPFPGIALRGETCGVVAGSLMALGLIFGRAYDLSNPLDVKQWAVCYPVEKCGEVVALGVRLAGEIILFTNRNKK